MYLLGVPDGKHDEHFEKRSTNLIEKPLDFLHPQG